MANVERPLLNLLKTKLEDGRAYVEGLQKRGIGILSNANILQIAEKIFLEKEIKNVQTQNIVESNNGYVGIRFSWNFQEITNNGFDPQTECDSIEIGVNIATKTLSFVQVGEESL